MKKASISMADTASRYCAIVLLGLIVLASVRENSSADVQAVRVRSQFFDRPCDEIYVVGEGETLHTISAKCDDPFIVERNPHIHDPDDVFPGLVIKIIPSRSIKDFAPEAFPWKFKKFRSSAFQAWWVYVFGKSVRESNPISRQKGIGVLMSKRITV